MCAYRKVGTFTVVKNGEQVVAKQGGNVATYFCTPRGEVVHAVAGNVDAEVLLREARWALALHERVRAEAGDDAEKRRALIAAAHRERAAEGWIFTSGTPNGGITFRPAVTTIELPQNGCGVVFTNGMTESRALDDANVNATTITFITSALVAVDANGPAVHRLLAELGGRALDEVYPRVWQEVLGEALSDAPVNLADFGGLLRIRAETLNVDVATRRPEMFIGTLIVAEPGIERPDAARVELHAQVLRALAAASAETAEAEAQATSGE